jgi:hypothetical protein
VSRPASPPGPLTPAGPVGLAEAIAFALRFGLAGHVLTADSDIQTCGGTRTMDLDAGCVSGTDLRLALLGPQVTRRR